MCKVFGVAVALTALLGAAVRSAAERLPHDRGHTAPVLVHEEYPDFDRFSAASYKQNLISHFREKYHDKLIGMIVAFGRLSLECAVDMPAGLWPKAPMLFGEVPDRASPRSSFPAAKANSA